MPQNEGETRLYRRRGKGERAEGEKSQSDRRSKGGKKADGGAANKGRGPNKSRERKEKLPDPDSPFAILKDLKIGS